jgi:hypothetical protein
VKGSRLKLGVLSGCGGDVHCGDSLETFTVRDTPTLTVHT